MENTPETAADGFTRREVWNIVGGCAMMLALSATAAQTGRFIEDFHNSGTVPEITGKPWTWVASPIADALTAGSRQVLIISDRPFPVD